MKALHNDPDRLSSVLRCRQWSYLSYLPQLFGEHAYLDDALRCVTARVSGFARRQGPDSLTGISSEYSIALRSLQLALDDPYRRLEAGVLCACCLLVIYELLELPRSNRWTHHIAGAMALTKLRGPFNFGTEMEKAMLLTLTGPFYTHAMLHAEPCFLDTQPWKDALCSAVREHTSFSESSEIMISLWTRIVSLPRILVDVKKVVAFPGLTFWLQVKSLRDRLENSRSELQNWKASYDHLIYAVGLESPIQHAGPVHDCRFQGLGIWLATLIMVNRMIASLDLSRGREMENEIKCLVRQIFALQEEAEKVDPKTYLFMAFKVLVAKAALRTEAAWVAAYVSAEQHTEALKIIPWPLFKEWTDLKGVRSHELY